MCGIVGATRQELGGQEWESLLRSMTATLVHRGPDDGGWWFDATAGVGLGHRRLSVIDLASTGRQPMVSHCERYVIVFNGEVYNFRDLRRELEARGHGFRGHSDTEVVLAAITEWGLKRALPHFIGMFAFGLWDREERQLVLVRDRLGKKPLYYGWGGEAFVFASELKAFRKHPEFQPSIDRDAVALLMRHNYIPAPYSIYHGVLKLPAGCWVAVRQGEAASKPVPYWSAKATAEHGVAEPLRCSENEVVEQLDALLRAAVRLRMVSDVPLGAFLSGGIDSSTIVALMQAQSSNPVKTFTIGFTDPAYNEADQAKRVAAHLGTDHTELYVQPNEARAVIPKLPSLYDEPFADSSQIPVALVSQLARESVTVCLSGDGGDELFGGYDRYQFGARIWSALQWVPRRLRNGSSRAIRRVSSESWDRLATVVAPVALRQFNTRDLGMKARRLADAMEGDGPALMYQGLVSHWQDPLEVVCGAKEPPTALTDPGRYAALPDIFQWMMYTDTVSYLPDDLLVKLDRASMGVSLEARVPLLDHRIVELAWRVPGSMKVRHGQGKWLLRQMLARYVPPNLTDRPKMGFGVPIDSWLRGPLREWAEDLLTESRLRREGFLNPRPIREKWQEHLEGRWNWQYLIWDVLMFQAWLEVWGPGQS